MNFFIAIAAFVIVLIVLFIGISQTSTFRDYLRDKIVEIVIYKGYWEGGGDCIYNYDSKSKTVKEIVCDICGA